MARGAGLSWDEFADRWAFGHGGFDARRSSTYVRRWLRASYLLGRSLAAVGVSPFAVTAMGVALSVLVPVAAVLRGAWLFAAAGLVVAAAVADSVDGAVALLTNRASALGSVQDAVADRVSEALWLVGLWLIGAPAALVAVCGAQAWLHEYVRARATVAGMTSVGAVTVAERPTRVIAAAAAFVVGGLAWMINPRLTPGAVTVVLAVWLLLGVLGGLKLAGAVRAQLRS